MSMSISQVVWTAVLLVVVLLSGFRLSRLGRPYGKSILTVHKLSSLTAATLFVLTFYQRNRVAPLSLIELAAGLTACVLFLGTVITGGSLSIDRPMPATVKRLHQITQSLTAISAAVALYLLVGR
jgi:hypothetical protein